MEGPVHSASSGSTIAAYDDATPIGCPLWRASYTSPHHYLHSLRALVSPAPPLLSPQHLRKSLEAAFQAADAGGAGALTLVEFAAVMFPRARPEALQASLRMVQRGARGVYLHHLVRVPHGTLQDIVTFITYGGPTLRPLASSAAGTDSTFGAAVSDDTGTPERLRALFDAHDLDGDGIIDQVELQRALAEVQSQKDGDAATAAELVRVLRGEGDEIYLDAFVRLLAPVLSSQSR